MDGIPWEIAAGLGTAIAAGFTALIKLLMKAQQAHMTCKDKRLADALEGANRERILSSSMAAAKVIIRTQQDRIKELEDQRGLNARGSQA